MRLLVTGSGRCGTQWITTALTMAGLPCTHEVHWTSTRHGAGPWQAEASWRAAPYLPVPDTHLVHLVRHPLKVIRSRLAGGLFTLPTPPRLRRLAEWTYRTAPEILNGSTAVERAAWHWMLWCRMIPESAQLLRLEDATADDITALAQKIRPRAAGIEQLPPREGGRAELGPPITWAQVITVPGLLPLAERYGYR